MIMSLQDVMQPVQILLRHFVEIVYGLILRDEGPEKNFISRKEVNGL